MSGIPLTMSRPIPLKRYRLGAEELIEMGDSRSSLNSRQSGRPERRPFLGDGARISMGAEELIEMGEPQASPAGPGTGTILAVLAVVAGITAVALALG